MRTDCGTEKKPEADTDTGQRVAGTPDRYHDSTFQSLGAAEGWMAALADGGDEKARSASTVNKYLAAVIRPPGSRT